MSVRGYEARPFISGHEQEGSQTCRGSSLPSAPSNLLHLLTDSFAASQRPPPPACPRFESLAPSPDGDALQKSSGGTRKSPSRSNVFGGNVSGNPREVIKVPAGSGLI